MKLCLSEFVSGALFLHLQLNFQIKKTERVEIIKFKMTQSYFFSDVINDISAVEL